MNNRFLEEKNFQPLLEKEFSVLLEQFSLDSKLTIAVSGGRDSMALALLVAEWARVSSIQVTALIVDHGLRPESAAESLTVRSWLDRLSLPCVILKWFPPKGLSTGVQKKARLARYSLLERWCIDNGVKTLMTAHHLLDQWETFMMRLAKGSGLHGLCGIRCDVQKKYTRVIRPLLTIHPERLLKTLQHFNQEFIQDPSNYNQRFTRSRWRALYPHLEKEGLEGEMLQQTINRLLITNNYLEEEMIKAKEICFYDNTLDLVYYQTLHKEIAYRLLSRILLKIGGGAYPLSFKSLETVYRRILQEKFIGITAGHCYLKCIKGKKIKITKENRLKK